MGVLLIVGTEKGAFLFRSDEGRARWAIEGPVFKGWKVTTAARDGQGRYFLGVASWVYGATIQVSDDLEKWRQVSGGPGYPQGGKRKLNQIWKIHPSRETIFAGVDEAGLFRSEETWTAVDGLNEHPTREAWFPGAGGLCAHAILTDPRNPKRMWCGISASRVPEPQSRGGLGAAYAGASAGALLRRGPARGVGD